MVSLVQVTTTFRLEESYSQPSHYPHVSNRDLGALQEEEDEEFGEEGEEDAGEHRETGTQKIETQKMTSSTNSNRQVKPHPESTGKLACCK